MPKAKPNLPNWVRNLRALMEQQGFNPRSLSLKSGLNPTAVRDMMEGRTKFPRYDTARSLAATLGVTPATLMSETSVNSEVGQKGEEYGEDLELLTEIIARLQEVIEEHKRHLPPRDFAAMAATIYHRMRESENRKKGHSAIRPQVHELFDYEMLRLKKTKRG